MIDGILRRPKKPAQTKISVSHQTFPEPPSGSVIEPTFQPPEMVAESGQPAPTVPLAAASAAMRSETAMPIPPRPVGATGATTTKPRHILGLKPKLFALVAVLSILVLGGGGAGAYMMLHKKKPAPTPAPKQAAVVTPEPPKPVVYTSPLTGAVVKQEETTLPVTGIMIENSPDARPQSGLKDAGVIYEAIAEGGITRFLALFQEAQPDYVGPVRSARPYYLEWLQGYDAPIAHVGGSPEALALIKSAGIKDLDQFYNTAPYWRINTRYAPHNMYTSLPKLHDLEASKGITSSKFVGFARKADKPSDTPTATSIDVTLSGYLYNVHYDYDKATNSYKRSEGGKPHLDDRSSAQLSPKVVVSLVMPYSIQADGLHSDYSTVGSGKAFIFQDGNVTAGTWSKAGSKDQLLLGDANGAPLGINAGQTWITAVGTEGSVAYK